MKITERWEFTPETWIPPFPILLFHLVHVAGGAGAVLFSMSVGGFTQADGSFHSMLLFSLIEGGTAIAKKNYKDSFFDWWQYQCHWCLLPASRGALEWSGIMFAVWLAGYFYMLWKGW